MDRVWPQTLLTGGTHTSDSESDNESVCPKTAGPKGGNRTTSDAMAETMTAKPTHMLLHACRGRGLLKAAGAARKEGRGVATAERRGRGRA